MAKDHRKKRVSYRFLARKAKMAKTTPFVSQPVERRGPSMTVAAKKLALAKSSSISLPAGIFSVSAGMPSSMTDGLSASGLVSSALGGPSSASAGMSTSNPTVSISSIMD